MWAPERLLLRVRAQVVHELGRVRHEPMAAAVLALEEFRVALVAIGVFE